MKKLTLFAFTVNQTVGVGFLGLPYAFQHSGMIYSIIVLAFCCYLSYYVGTLAVEIIFKDYEIKVPLHGKKLKQYVQLVDDHHSIIICALLTIFGSGCALAFSLIFASSMSLNIPLPYFPTCDIYDTAHPECLINFRIYLTIFIISTYILALRGVHEQKSVQLLMAFLRLLLVTTLVLVALYRIISGVSTEPISIINPSEIESTFSVIVYAVVYHHALPSIAQICEDSIIEMPKLVTWAIFISYALVGTIIGIAFPNVSAQCNLSYGYLDGVFGEIIKIIVMILPATDVIASGPVVVIMITENILGYFHEKSRTYEVLVISCIVAILYSVAFFMQDLFGVIDAAGMSMIAIVFLYIPVIHLKHWREDASARHDSKDFHHMISYFVMGVSIFYMTYRLVLVIYSLV
ncbi:hypothetical protein SteCoe_17839 [Stentor coeruleus]|uniref:Amino acid transporter transmembrane domain-containing protein n=1 Tax=Stentor coeruleus TaxID=5963 RepID=A0A1R2BXU3_9CILI|nr:hypothetical protein SteCoe_17839 [Stentor coeruleus]